MNSLVEIALQKDFSVGLFSSDLISTDVKPNVSRSNYGTGVNLTLVLSLLVKTSEAEAREQYWKQLLGEIVSEIDHVHLEFDHPELKEQKLTEKGLLEWINKQFITRSQLNSSNAIKELRKVSLITAQNYTVSIEL